MAERGWYATGLLKPLWGRVGGRDELARLAGISTPQTLSAYNSGERRLGTENGRKIAQALGVSLLELGAPEGQADEEGRTLLDRLEDHEERTAKSIRKLRRDLNTAIRRIRVLEAQSQPKPNRSMRGGENH